MKVRLDIDIPEYNWVDVPTLYRTPIGEFDNIDHVNQIKYLIEYLQRLDEIEWIINSNHQHVRHPFCRELVRDRLKFIADDLIYYYGEKLSYFLMRFGEYSGLSFKEYEFDYIVLSNGKKVQFKTFTKLFDTEDEAIKYYCGVATSRDFEYTIVNNNGKE